MNLKKELLRKSKACAIVNYSGKDSTGLLFKKINALIQAKIDIIQLRAKECPPKQIVRIARLIKKRLRGKDILFIINDYPQAARLSKADGVHLGQEDIGIEEARRILGKNKLIGISCSSLAQAMDAQELGADYIGIGPVFPTPLKTNKKTISPGLIRKISKIIRIPFFAIGGINSSNLDQVTAMGAQRVAFIRAINQAREISLKLK